MDGNYGKKVVCMSFKDAIVTCFKKYATFSGRARRSEYWYFSLFNMLVSFVLTMVLGDSIIVSLVSLALVVPGLAVSWRRLHDIGRSGAWVFIALVPLVGAILLLVWECTDSQPGENKYGPNPKEAA